MSGGEVLVLTGFKAEEALRPKLMLAVLVFSPNEWPCLCSPPPPVSPLLHHFSAPALLLSSSSVLFFGAEPSIT